MRLRALGFAVAVVLCAATARAEAEPDWVLFSEVMTELSKQPEFVEALLERLGRDPAAGGILGPENIKKFRELVLGKEFEALDRFPAMTVEGMGRAVRLAARAAKQSEREAAAEETTADLEESPAPEPAPAPEDDLEEPLGIPTHGVAPAPGIWMREVGFGLEAGDNLDPALAPLYADGERLSSALNRLAANAAEGEPGPRYRVTVAKGRAETPEGLIDLLVDGGHDVEVADARYFANFGDLIYQSRDVLTPFWVDTRIAVPGTERSLLVPVSHSQHELRVRGPAVNAELSFYFGIDGKAEFRPIATRDQSWTLGTAARTYRGDDALEVVRFAGAIIRSYDSIQRRHPDLPFGGYYALGVCNDVNAMIEQHMQGETTLFPLTHDPRYFAGDGEVEQLARALPVDGRGARPDPRRILGSLPVAQIAALPLPALRSDLEQVRSAWKGGELEFVDAWGIFEWLAVSVAAFLALLVTAAVFAIRHWRRRAAARSPAS
jgi:hypothetical protein